jgi:hypothetical protein
MEVVRTDLAEFLDRGTVQCRLTVGGRSVRAAAHRFVDGTPTCRWRVPAGAAGSGLKLTITVRFGGAVVTKTLARRAR